MLRETFLSSNSKWILKILRIRITFSHMFNLLVDRENISWSEQSCGQQVKQTKVIQKKILKRKGKIFI